MRLKQLTTTAAFLISCTISLSAQTIYYPVVDTGQTSAYGDYSGQDANYAGHAASYKVSNGTVTDTVTGLMWTKDPGAKMSYAEAVKNAPKCEVGGHKDWRLPTIKELYSLIKLDGIDPDPMAKDTTNLKPFIDVSVFDFKYGDPSKGERIIDSQFATSTKYVSTTMGGDETLFGVNFADGRIKGYPIKNRRGEKTFHVLYVRGNSDYGVNKFKDNGDGTISDVATGLTWMKADSEQGMDWPTALKYAADMELAGHSDWRLPNAKELQSIVDYTRSPDTSDSAAINQVFESTAIKNEGGKKDFGHYWSSSTHVSSRSNTAASYFAFGRSLGWMGSGDEKTLMDVHGAGSQRSDPKTGDASKFPFGHGPQGDVIRIKNMVRLVRGGEVKEVDAPVVGEMVHSKAGGEKRFKELAKDQGEKPEPNREQGGGGFITREDKNGDGKVSKGEFGGPAKHFERFDKNKDGYLTEDEAPKGRHEGQTQRR
ncbi:MAG: Lcl domain-containing protein [Akkermansiaceae bacterium]